jgi:hypothetical protein
VATPTHNVAAAQRLRRHAGRQGRPCTVLPWGQHRGGAANARRNPGSCTSKDRCGPLTVLLCSPKWLTKVPRAPTPGGSLPAFAAGSSRPEAQPLSGPLPAGVRLLPHPLPAVPSARLTARFP